MIESLLHFWEHLPFLIKWPLWFWFNIVIIRGILAKRIIAWVDEKGWFDHWLLEPVATEWQRFRVIVQHEIDKARGFQHESKVEHCTYGNCSNL